ncbi:unnamed protein product, partial [Didymodactylos carnosus]
MLLHDTYFILSNDTSPSTIIHSPVFGSKTTFILSLIGTFCNLLCTGKLFYLIEYTTSTKLKPKLFSGDTKYYFFIILTISDFLLCLSAIISCLDENYFPFFLAKYNLCSLNILLWKFTLHFTPLLTITILCRYHYLFECYKHYSRTLNQVFCTNLSILLPVILSLA